MLCVSKDKLEVNGSASVRLKEFKWARSFSERLRGARSSTIDKVFKGHRERHLAGNY